MVKEKHNSPSKSAKKRNMSKLQTNFNKNLQKLKKAIADNDLPGKIHNVASKLQVLTSTTIDPDSSEKKDQLKNQINKDNYSEESDREEVEEGTPSTSRVKIDKEEAKKIETSSADINAIKKERQKKNKNKKNALDEDPESRKIYVRNIPMVLTKTHLHKLFSRFGEVENLKFTQKSGETRTCWILFKKHKGARKSMKLNGMLFKGHHLFVKNIQGEDISVLHSVSIKYHPDMNTDIIWTTFEPFGVIKYVQKIPAIERAIIRFESIDSVEIALHTGQVTIGNHNCHILKVKEGDIPSDYRNTAKKTSLKLAQRVQPQQPAILKAFSNKKPNTSSGTTRILPQKQFPHKKPKQFKQHQKIHHTTTTS